REMIGLAATAQIAIIPSWLGLVIAQGVPPTSMSGDVEKRILSLVLNIVCVIVAALVIFIVTRTAHASLRKLSTK
ncbi:MAG: hypothetical protein ACJ73D_02930, partial [Pyrinomonadaceae bacterium]